MLHCFLKTKCARHFYLHARCRICSAINILALRTRKDAATLIASGRLLKLRAHVPTVLKVTYYWVRVPGVNPEWRYCYLKEPASSKCFFSSDFHFFLCKTAPKLVKLQRGSCSPFTEGRDVARNGSLDTRAISTKYAFIKKRILDKLTTLFIGKAQGCVGRRKKLQIPRAVGIGLSEDFISVCE